MLKTVDFKIDEIFFDLKQFDLNVDGSVFVRVAVGEKNASASGFGLSSSAVTGKL